MKGVNLSVTSSHFFFFKRLGLFLSYKRCNYARWRLSLRIAEDAEAERVRLKYQGSFSSRDHSPDDNRGVPLGSGSLAKLCIGAIFLFINFYVCVCVCAWEFLHFIGGKAYRRFLFNLFFCLLPYLPKCLQQSPNSCISSQSQSRNFNFPTHS